MRAYLGLGSNLGDRLANLQRAVDLLGDQPGIRVDGSSGVWETDPVGGPSQPDYLNAVVAVSTELSPWELLSACGRVEDALGRVREIRWGPRTIDVDVLLLDAVEMDDPSLTVPHPRMTERAFVLLPLLELEPDVALPDGTPLATFLDRLDPGGARPAGPPLVPGA